MRQRKLVFQYDFRVLGISAITSGWQLSLDFGSAADSSGSTDDSHVCLRQNDAWFLLLTIGIGPANSIVKIQRLQ